MLRITVDLFSGRPNPTWTLDEQQAQNILKEVALNRGVVSAQGEGYRHLGFRGLQISFESDHLAQSYGLPSSFLIANGASMYESKSMEIAERILNDASNQPTVAEISSSITTSLNKWITAEMAALPRLTNSVSTTAPDEVSRAAVTPFTNCAHEIVKFEPDFWNDHLHVQNNNCYNFATNRRTNTFAQPGRASGQMYTSLTCSAVTQGALADGIHKVDNCFVESEKPRYLMALVVSPGPSFVDYHWYRLCEDRHWAHKPGGTPAIDVDNSNHFITDPRTADRGPYTQFCGFMLSARSVRVN